MKSEKNDLITLDDLKEKVTMAFKDVEYPGDDKIAIKQWYLDDEQLVGYVGRKREDVTVDFINEGHRDCTTFMTKQAIRYYLPAFLLLCAEHTYDMDVFADRIFAELIPPLKEDYERVLQCIQEETGQTPEEAHVFPSNDDELNAARTEFFSFVAMLSKQQREAVYYFLVYYESRYQDSYGEAALNRFWKEFKDYDFEFKAPESAR